MRLTLKSVAWAACLAATLYAAAYCFLRVQDRFIVYRGEVFYGRWTSSQTLIAHPHRLKSFEVSKRPEVFFAPLARLELSAFRLVGRNSPINYFTGTVPIHGAMKSSEVASRVQPQLSQWTLIGGWYDHLEWSDRESYHLVYHASEVSPEVLRNLVRFGEPDGDVIEDKALSAPKAVGGFVFPVTSVRRRCVGDEGHWREVVFDETQNLLCVTIGVDD